MPSVKPNGLRSPTSRHRILVTCARGSRHVSWRSIGSGTRLGRAWRHVGHVVMKRGCRLHKTAASTSNGETIWVGPVPLEPPKKQHRCGWKPPYHFRKKRPHRPGPRRPSTSPPRFQNQCGASLANHPGLPLVMRDDLPDTRVPGAVAARAPYNHRRPWLRIASMMKPPCVQTSISRIIFGMRRRAPIVSQLSPTRFLGGTCRPRQPSSTGRALSPTSRTLSLNGVTNLIGGGESRLQCVHARLMGDTTRLCFDTSL